MGPVSSPTTWQGIYDEAAELDRVRRRRRVSATDATGAALLTAITAELGAVPDVQFAAALIPMLVATMRQAATARSVAKQPLFLPGWPKGLGITR